MNVKAEIKSSGFKKYFLILVTISILGYLTYLFANILGIVFLSVLIATLFDPLISFVESRGVKRLFSTLIVFVAIISLFYLLLASFIPKLALQFDSFIQTFKNISFQENITLLESQLRNYFPFLPDGFLTHKLEAIIVTGIEGGLSTLGTGFSGLFAIVALLVVLPFTTFFIVKDKNILLKGIVDLFPNRYFEMSYWILKRVTDKLTSYVRGWIIDAAFVGVACGLGFSFIGIENSIILGFIAGIGHLIPYLGPIIGGVPALLISIIQFGDLSALPLIVILVLIIYTLDNGFVQPYVFSKNVDIHPLMIILIIIAGGELFGIVGMLFAVPAVTILRTALQEYSFASKNYKITSSG